MTYSQPPRTTLRRGRTKNELPTLNASEPQSLRRAAGATETYDSTKEHRERKRHTPTRRHAPRELAFEFFDRAALTPHRAGTGQIVARPSMQRCL